MSSELLPIRIGLDSHQVLVLRAPETFPTEAESTWVWTLSIGANRVAPNAPCITETAATQTKSADSRQMTLTFDIADTETTGQDPGTYAYDLVSNDGTKDRWWGGGVVNLIRQVGMR